MTKRCNFYLDPTDNNEFAMQVSKRARLVITPFR